MQVSEISYGTGTGNLQDSIFIGKWFVGQRTISLLKNQKGFAYSDDGKIRGISQKLYDIESLTDIVQVFDQTIQENLKKESTSSSCFIPKVCYEVHSPMKAKVALFGEVVKNSINPTGEVKWFRWGVSNLSTGENQTFEIEDGIAKMFILNAPKTNKPHQVEIEDKDGKKIKKEAKDHMELSSYAKRFCLKVSHDDSLHIQKIALYGISLVNEKVLLDEDNWAVTLGSALKSTHSILNKFCSSEFLGHAMLICEGVSEIGPFLKYLHLTRNPRNKNPNLGEDEAQIESFESATPLGTVNGPTWIRSRTLVKNMLQFAETMRGIPVKFSPYAIFSSPGKRREIEVEDMAYHVFGIKPPNRIPEFINTPHTCLEWAQEISERGGIIFCFRYPESTPLDQIEIIREYPTVLLPSNFDQKDFGGNSLIEKNENLARQILSACVLLTPDDFPLEDCNKWRQQRKVEEVRSYERKEVYNFLVSPGTGMVLGIAIRKIERERNIVSPLRNPSNVNL